VSALLRDELKGQLETFERNHLDAVQGLKGSKASYLGGKAEEVNEVVAHREHTGAFDTEEELPF
jgi:hypothetical protein